MNRDQSVWRKRPHVRSRRHMHISLVEGPGRGSLQRERGERRDMDETDE